MLTKTECFIIAVLVLTGLFIGASLWQNFAGIIDLGQLADTIMSDGWSVASVLGF